jgi:hypothetical protein
MQRTYRAMLYEILFVQLEERIHKAGCLFPVLGNRIWCIDIIDITYRYIVSRGFSRYDIISYRIKYRIDKSRYSISNDAYIGYSPRYTEEPISYVNYQL